MAKLRCPHCGSDLIVSTTKGSIIKNAAEFGGVVLDGVVKTVANNVLFEGAGRLIPKVGQGLANMVSEECVCQDCDCLFSTSYDSEGDVKGTTLKKRPMPEQLVAQVRDGYVKKLQNDRPYVSTWIFGLLTLYCFVWFIIGAMDSSGGQIVFGQLFGIIFLIPTIIKWNKISSLNKEIEECELQTLREFKHSHRDLFRQYSQYN